MIFVRGVLLSASLSFLAACSGETGDSGEAAAPRAQLRTTSQASSGELDRAPEKPLTLQLDPERKKEVISPLVEDELQGEPPAPAAASDQTSEEPSALQALKRLEVEMDDEGNPIVGFRLKEKSDAANRADREYLGELDESHPLRSETEVTGRVP